LFLTVLKLSPDLAVTVSKLLIMSSTRSSHSGVQVSSDAWTVVVQSAGTDTHHSLLISWMSKLRHNVRCKVMVSLVRCGMVV